MVKSKDGLVSLIGAEILKTQYTKRRATQCHLTQMQLMVLNKGWATSPDNPVYQARLAAARGGREEE